MNARGSGGVRFAIAPSAMSMGSWWRSGSESCAFPVGWVRQRSATAVYSLVILRRARSGDSGIDLADAPGVVSSCCPLEEVLRQPGWMELAACAGLPIGCSSRRTVRQPPRPETSAPLPRSSPSVSTRPGPKATRWDTLEGRRSVSAGSCGRPAERLRCRSRSRCRTGARRRSLRRCWSFPRSHSLIFPGPIPVTPAGSVLSPRGRIWRFTAARHIPHRRNRLVEARHDDRTTR